MATFHDFKKLDIRIGKNIEVDEFPETLNPAYKRNIDFGQKIGTKKSSAQLAENYSQGELQDRLVLCVVNFSPKQIGPLKSEVLVL